MIKPRNAYVLIHPWDEPNDAALKATDSVVESGRRPGSSREYKRGYKRGTVRAVGPGYVLEGGDGDGQVYRPLPHLEVDDVVLYDGYAAVAVHRDGEEDHLVDERAVLAVLTDEDAIPPSSSKLKLVVNEDTGKFEVEGRP